MVKVICVANIKGGVGKTTIVHNLSHALSLKGKKVLMIDLDMQENLSDRSIINRDDIDNTVYQLLTNDDLSIEQCIYKSRIPNVDIIPSQVNIGEAGRILELKGMGNRLFVLKERLKDISSKYDFILMDIHPSLDYLFATALVASDYYIIPVTPGIDSIKGINLTRKFVNSIKNINGNLEELGILINDYDKRTTLSKRIVSSLENNIGAKLFKAKICHGICIAQAALDRMTTFQHSSRNACNSEFLELSLEIMKKITY